MHVASVSSECGGDSGSSAIMRTFRIFCFLCLLCTASIVARSVPRSEFEADNGPRLLFVFGDSYADTGNTPDTTPGWHAPYGISWPGSPSGRFSDGFVMTDFLALNLGIPPPTPYSQLYSNTATSGGINFAVGGSGTTLAYRSPSFEAQVGQFAGLVYGGFFTAEVLDRAVFFVSVVGNDYAAYSGPTLEGYSALSHGVPCLIDLNIRILHSVGARNFVVSSVAPLSCLPSRTFVSGYARCDKNATVRSVVATHNHYLGTRLMNIMRSWNDSSILYLEQTKAMNYVLDNLSEFNLTNGLKPCCNRTVDENGNPLLTVCDGPDQHFFWDDMHPTQAGWRAVMDLYTNHSRFTRFSPSLRVWIDTLRS